jgi:Fanconi-associated nuclease 1
MTLEDLMSCIPADELKRLARARKVPPASLLNRESTVRALVKVASQQTTLGFTPVGKGKGKTGTSQATLPFTPNKAATSQSLLVTALQPLLGGGAVQLTPELHALIARVNLLFTRTPPLTSTSSSLMLPSILVTSHKRRYPEYGSPTRSRIWATREDLLSWERVIYWEGLVADALGDTWAEQKRNPVPGFGMRRDMLSRTEGAKVVKRVWEGIWPAWKELVEGDKGQAVDAKNEEGGLVGDRFKIGKSRSVFSDDADF